MAPKHAILVGLALMVAHASARSSQNDWDYKICGPDCWKEKYAECKGGEQSPIDILPFEAEYNRYFHPFDFDGYDNVWDVTMKMTNSAGRTVKIGLSGAPVMVREGSLPAPEYQLRNILFHWGSSALSGSEHTIAGEKQPMEMQLIHAMPGRSSPGQVMIISFLFQIGPHNPYLDPIVEYLPAITRADTSVDLEPFSLYELLPDYNIDYWRYDGSYTTPPCTENVIWSVMQQPIDISQDQLQKFRDLRDFDGQPVVDNFRPPQPLNGRRVQSSAYYKK